MSAERGPRRETARGAKHRPARGSPEAEGRFIRPRGQASGRQRPGVKEGARGGTMGSPTLKPWVPPRSNHGFPRGACGVLVDPVAAEAVELLREEVARVARPRGRRVELLAVDGDALQSPRLLVRPLDVAFEARAQP